MYTNYKQMNTDTKANTNTGTGTNTFKYIYRLKFPEKNVSYFPGYQFIRNVPMSYNYDVLEQMAKAYSCPEKKQRDEKWFMLRKLCIENPQTFMKLLPCFDPLILNHINHNWEYSNTLFDVGVKSGNSELVECMLSSGLFTDDTLNFQGGYSFIKACMTNIDIAFQILFSDKFSPLVINKCVDNYHPFELLVMNKNTTSKYPDCFENLKLAMGSDKFLKDCTEQLKISVMCRFMRPSSCHKIVSISLNCEKMTRDIIEKIRFSGNKTIIEEYCKHGDAELLKILLDSEKVSKEWVCSVCSNLVIGDYNADIQQVLKSHEKLEDPNKKTCDELEARLVELEIEHCDLNVKLCELEKTIAELKLQQL